MKNTSDSPVKPRSALTPIEHLKEEAAHAKQRAEEAAVHQADLIRKLNGYEFQLHRLEQARDWVAQQMGDLIGMETDLNSQALSSYEVALGALGPNCNGDLWRAASLKFRDTKDLLALIPEQRATMKIALEKAEKEIADFLQKDAPSEGARVADDLEAQERTFSQRLNSL